LRKNKKCWQNNRYTDRTAVSGRKSAARRMARVPNNNTLLAEQQVPVTAITRPWQELQVLEEQQVLIGADKTIVAEITADGERTANSDRTTGAYEKQVLLTSQKILQSICFMTYVQYCVAIVLSPLL
jgi:hypothetical protein